jgi:hypothetical protein
VCKDKMKWRTAGENTRGGGGRNYNCNLKKKNDRICTNENIGPKHSKRFLAWLEKKTCACELVRVKNGETDVEPSTKNFGVTQSLHMRVQS